MTIRLSLRQYEPGLIRPYSQVYLKRCSVLAAAQQVGHLSPAKAWQLHMRVSKSLEFLMSAGFRSCSCGSVWLQAQLCKDTYSSELRLHFPEPFFPDPMAANATLRLKEQHLLALPPDLQRCKPQTSPHFRNHNTGGLLAGVILETAARASGRNARASKESKILQAFAQDVASLVSATLSSSGSPIVQCAALEALLWSQVYPPSLPKHPRLAAHTCCSKSRLPGLHHPPHSALRNTTLWAISNCVGYHRMLLASLCAIALYVTPLVLHLLPARV